MSGQDTQPTEAIVTPEMIEAGVNALLDSRVCFETGSSYEDAVRLVFQAMYAATRCTDAA